MWISYFNFKQVLLNSCNKYIIKKARSVVVGITTKCGIDIWYPVKLLNHIITLLSWQLVGQLVIWLEVHILVIDQLCYKYVPKFCLVDILFIIPLFQLKLVSWEWSDLTNYSIFLSLISNWKPKLKIRFLLVCVQYLAKNDLILLFRHIHMINVKLKYLKIIYSIRINIFVIALINSFTST